ncbi:hypothetical protein LFYK43_14290 [Ligilactobacillus salitolerans]|uniref:Uncharacterized protein n=1 Tax=Ligilactobacillus salitolerans TaxID=1808352 RepID=A0A401ITU6_9LACO|nr:hypothetical protein [Ligilactobacillus salitolerans]GBG94970.1 hypothetical protein LFYK43_14290 [Ligilactobacillus salitolerans]
MKLVKTIPKLVYKFWSLNEPQVLMICGFCMLSVGAFKLSDIAGWFVSGSLVVILALLSAWLAGRG